ncbi:phage head closure protein [Chromohalobacter sp. TMW 2.2308]|uniref:Phage head closure protein n=1 Tax=Chromohalobacter moromii TaxID=2860329 RepID=A0A9X3AY79_9GAMM|nr:phage head closure protein [Chromohalobacter moromii]MCK2042562.1 phage head closure protein [Chromohalobacter moromii]MCT8506141.1 phage head closure protein [Chromohalobacter moromii]
MRAGRLRHRVTLQRPVDGAKDQYNQPTESFEQVATVWASVEPLRGREFFEAQQVNSEITTRIRCRYRRDLAGVEVNEWRIEYRGRTYEIDGPPINSRMEDRQLEFMCHERL